MDLNRKLSEHFTLREMVKSFDADRQGIDNTEGLTEEIVQNLVYICVNVLEPVRKYFGLPVRINSAYRCLALNRYLKSSDNSDHRIGCAVDFEINGISNVELAQWVHKNVAVYDQLILEFFYPEKNDPNSGWVHVSLHKIANMNKHERFIINGNGRQSIGW